MRYIPVIPKDREKMLKDIGVSSVEELFESVPKDIRMKGTLDLPKAFSEQDLLKQFEEISNKNTRHGALDFKSFLGAGSYEHYIPAAVDHLSMRSEFYTAYTPYQAELSQGTLQSIFEFQSMICAISGMEVANASMYDGASSLAEAILMAERIKKKKNVLLASTVHPEYKQVVEAYTKEKGIELHEIPFSKDGLCDYEKTSASDISCIVVQYPNFLGVIENLKKAKELAVKKDALFIVVCTEPVALGVLSPPGEFGCDIFVGEGQSFGNTLNYGGPHLGLMAVRKEFIRSMPGRIAGKTKDAEGKDGYVLYMATREQHIRREKATSNICTNNGLCALRALIYLSLLGRRGFKALSAKNLKNSRYLRGKLDQTRGVEIKFSAPTFNEFVFSTAESSQVVLDKLKDAGILGGIPLSIYFKEYETSILVNATETKSKKDLDDYVEVVKQCM